MRLLVLCYSTGSCPASSKGNGEPGRLGLIPELAVFPDRGMSPVLTQHQGRTRGRDAHVAGTHTWRISETFSCNTEHDCDRSRRTITWGFNISKDMNAKTSSLPTKVHVCGVHFPPYH